MATITIKVPAVPVAQPRQRQRIIQPKNGDKPFVHNYTPANSPANAFKASVRQAWSEATMGPPIDGPVGIHMVFVMPRPRIKYWKTKEMPREWDVRKPDFDNLAKAVCDALSGLAFLDDKQICRASIDTVVASGHESPHVVVEVEALEGVPILPGETFAAMPHVNEPDVTVK